MSVAPWEDREKQGVMGISKLEDWFCGTPSVQLVEPEPYFDSGSQLLPA